MHIWLWKLDNCGFCTTYEIITTLYIMMTINILTKGLIKLPCWDCALHASQASFQLGTSISLVQRTSEVICFPHTGNPWTLHMGIPGKRSQQVWESTWMHRMTNYQLLCLRMDLWLESSAISISGRTLFMGPRCHSLILSNEKGGLTLHNGRKRV